MLRFTLQNGIVELENPELEARIIEADARFRAEADAEQKALSVVYRIAGEEDDSRPWKGLLTHRLDISERTARQLIADGLINYTCVGKKNYRVSEEDVRAFLRRGKSLNNAA